MTAIIDTNFLSFLSVDQVTQNYDYDTGPNSQSRHQTTNSLLIDSQNCLSVIIKQTHCPYFLLFTMNTTPLTTQIKIHLLKSNGILIKITSQQSKAYLIRKFHQFNDLYAPSINPCTGEIYFDLGYFNMKPLGNICTQRNFKIFYNNLSQEKLYQSIEKFSLFYQDGQKNNWVETNVDVEKNYQLLSKTICAVNDSDLIQIESLNQHTKKENEANKQKNKQKQLISHLKHYFSTLKYSPQPCNKSFISKQIKEIQFQAYNLNALTKRKKGKSNYETLLVNHSTQKQIREAIFKMVESKALRTSFKVNKSQMGKITLNIEKQQESTFRAKMRFLNQLPKNTEYHFLDKFFKCPDSLPVMISLSLKEESVHRYLLTNSLCISLQTKMRIILQICSAVHTLWEQKSILLNVNCFKKIHITKNLTIKLRNFASFCKLEQNSMLEEKAEVNLRLLDNWLNLSQLYFKLFYNYDIGFVRPADHSQAAMKSNQVFKSVVLSKRAVGEKLIPEGFQDPTKQMLVGLNYIFLSFIHKAGKTFVDHNNRKQSENQISMNIKSKFEKENENEKTKRLLSFKLMCCWLFKNFQMITREQ